MKRTLVMLLVGTLMMGSALSVHAVDHTYLDEETYNSLARGEIYTDKGIVIENRPMLGYLVYKNAKGQEVTANYYSSELTVEKQPYYEAEDRIGYMDELFPSFQFDVRDTTISQIKPGDNIYLQMDKEGYVQYVSACNDYIVRYGKVNTVSKGAQPMLSIVLEDESGRLYNYKISGNTPISKASMPYSLGMLKEGEWVRLLVNQKVLGAGIVEETVEEIVVDPDSRVISNIYKGEFLNVNSYQNTLTIKNNQVLQKNGWGPYESIKQVRIDPRNIMAYYLGNPVGFDYVKSGLKGTGGYIYAAVEAFRGKDEAVKLNFQTKQQRTFEPTTVTYASPGVIRLLSGEQIYLSDDAIIVRENRLVGPASIMVGDQIQAVVTGENKLAVARIMQGVAEGSLEVYRGRIKKVNDFFTFEVETFSMLEEGEWYFHPTPHTFSIGANTKFYNDQGITLNGIEEFVTYGSSSKENEVYTIVAQGGETVAISSMPYTKEAIKGEAYITKDGQIKLKDTYYFDRVRERWTLLSRKNAAVDVSINPQTMVLKEGKFVSPAAIESGDSLMIMMEDSIKDSQNNNENNNEASGYKTDAYIIIVQ